MIDNRQIAFLAWAAAAVLAALVYMTTDSNRRQTLFAPFRMAVSPKILATLLGAGAYTAGLVFLGRWLGLWGTALCFDTALWFFGTAIALIFSLTDATRDEHFFRRTALRALKVTVFVEVFVNFHIFSLPVELVLVPVLSFVALLSLFAATKKETLKVKHACDFILAVVGLVLLGFTTAHLIGDWSTLDKTPLWQSLALPAWLTLAYLPFIYILSLYSGYEMAFLRFDHLASSRCSSARRAKLALVYGLHCRYSLVNRFGGIWLEKVLNADTRRQARLVVRQYRHSRREEARAAREKQRRLRRFAGIDGVDGKGHRLDQREFDATRQSLMMLATAQMGWFRQLGRYRSDLLEMFTSNLLGKGLPEHHGITLPVSADSKAWYAWRRTISGWCFAVGACAPPPDEWMFDGPDPPDGFPGEDPAWGGRWGARRQELVR